MSTVDKPILPISAVTQVGITVNNLQQTMENYWNILGIGPWRVFTFGTPDISDLTRYGSPARGRYRAAIARVGPLELELIQTIEGDSIYRDWIYEHGEGLHHVKFTVADGDMDRVIQTMERLGFPRTMGCHVGPEGRWQFGYFDTMSALHAIWEASNREGDLKGETVYPEDPGAATPASVKVSRIRQIALCVRDAVRTAENYWNTLGIGPWRVYDWGSHVIHRRVYHGRPTWGREIVAFTTVGDVELELCQPVEGAAIYQDWLDAHGEGLHHLKFLCDDVDATSEALTGQGFPSIQSGHYGPEGEKAGGYNYIHIPPLHAIWEPVQEPKSMPAQPFIRVPQ